MTGTEPTETFDDATYRLGTYLAVVFGVQFVAHLLGIGVEGVRIEVLHILFFFAALAVRNRRVWGRTVFVVVNLFGAAALVLFVIFVGNVGALLLLAFGLACLFLNLCAVAFTIPEAGVALDLPERWRPWATSQALHLFILVVGLLGTFQGEL